MNKDPALANYGFYSLPPKNLINVGNIS